MFTITAGTEACTFSGIDASELAEKVHEIFITDGYRVGGQEGSVTIYEKGSKLKRILLGAMVKYFKVGVSLHIDANSEVIVTLQNKLGPSGGSTALRRIRKEHGRLIARLQEL
jgi:hypothetical protein